MNVFFKSNSSTIKHWYGPLIWGVLFILLGCYILSVPVATYLTLTYFFSFSFLMTGILEIAFSIRNKEHMQAWGWYLTSGIITFLIGLFLVVNQAVSITLLPIYVGMSLLFRSAQGLGLAIEWKNHKRLRWGNLAVMSVLGIILSLVLIGNPMVTGVSLVTLTSISFIIVGFTSVVLAFDLRRMKNIQAQEHDTHR